MSLSENRVATGSMDSNIKIWRIASAYEPNNRMNRRILERDAWAGDCLMTLSGHTDEIIGIELMSNNQIVSNSRDQTLRVWNLVTGECSMQIINVKYDIECMKVMQNNNLVSCGNGDNIDVWDLNRGIWAKSLVNHIQVEFLDILAGQKIVSLSQKRAKIWNVNTGDCLKQILIYDGTYNQTVTGFRTHAKGLLVIRKNKIQIYCLKRSELLVSFDNENEILKFLMITKTKIAVYLRNCELSIRDLESGSAKIQELQTSFNETFFMQIYESF